MSQVPALSIQNLQKTYDNGVQALKGIDLEIAQGDFFSLLGPNGAGKSTAINIVTSLVKKTAGTVNVFGYNLDRQLNAAKAHLGIVPQEINLGLFERCFDILVNQAGYYGVPRKVAKVRAESLMKRLDLWEKRDSVSRS